MPAPRMVQAFHCPAASKAPISASRIPLEYRWGAGTGGVGVPRELAAPPLFGKPPTSSVTLSPRLFLGFMAPTKRDRSR